MNKRETFQLLKQITSLYDQFDITQDKVDVWHEVLRGYSAEEIQGNLHTYARESAYPPKLSELITHGSTVPDLLETVRITASLEPACERVVQAELAKMRSILGIGG